MTVELDPIRRLFTGAILADEPTAVQRRMGTIDTLDPGPPQTVTVVVGGLAIPGVSYLNSYDPVVGDQVVVDFNGSDPLVLGSLTAASPWATYTPTIFADGGSQPSLGTGSTVVGRYVEMSRVAHVTATYRWGSSGSSPGSGGYYFNLPVPCVPPVAGQVAKTCGSGFIWSGSVLRLIVPFLFVEANYCRAWYDNNAALALSAGDPWAWGNNMQIAFNLTYETAP